MSNFPNWLLPTIERIQENYSKLPKASAHHDKLEFVDTFYKTHNIGKEKKWNHNSLFTK